MFIKPAAAMPPRMPLAIGLPSMPPIPALEGKLPVGAPPLVTGLPPPSNWPSSPGCFC
jgi:hypothetical protein